MIHCLQHFCVGVTDLDASHRFYRDVLGFRIRGLAAKVSSGPRNAERLIAARRYEENHRYAVDFFLLMHPGGGCAVELGRAAQARPETQGAPLRWGDRGAVELGLEVASLEGYCEWLGQQGIEPLAPICPFPCESDHRWNSAYIRDPDGLLIQLLEKATGASAGRPRTLGIHHLGIGVDDLAKAEDFYTGALRFTETRWRWRGTLSPAAAATPAPIDAEMVFLDHDRSLPGRLRSLDRGMVKLVHVPASSGPTARNNRPAPRYGDLGLMEIALDGRDVDTEVARLAAMGCEVLLPKVTIGMGLPGSTLEFALFRDPASAAILEIVDFRRILGLPSHFVLDGLLGAARRFCAASGRGLDVSRLFPGDHDLD